MSTETEPEKFPCSLTIDVPLPDNRLATIAQRALQVDAELSPLVRRTFSVVSPSASSSLNPPPDNSAADPSDMNVLRTEYRATTNRMLRVAVNGFMESLRVVLQIMQELDVDVLAAQASSQDQLPGQT